VIALTKSQVVLMWLCVACALLACAASANATTRALTVTTVLDNDTSATAVGQCASGGTCTLRDAINQANLDSADTITVPAGPYALNSLYGQLTATANMTITGAGAAGTTVSGLNATRILTVSSPAVVSISGLMLENGNASGDRGGALFVSAGASLTVSDCVLTANTEVNGGGAIEDLGTLTLTHSTVTGNGSAGHGRGGGIEVNQFSASTPSTATISDSTISGNQAFGGGGLEVQNFTSSTANVTVTVTNSTLAGNTATGDGTDGGSGGAIEDDVQTAPVNLTVTNSTITGNTAVSGSATGSFGGGLALENSGGVQQFTNDTISSNTAPPGMSSQSFGGDVFVSTGSGAPQFLGTIVNAGSAGVGPNCDGTLTSLGHNVEGATDCAFTATGDLQSTNPALGPLQDNGGPVQTMALTMGSPAIDRGSGTGCPGSDARGVIRPQGGGCDIGAYEWAPPVPGATNASSITPSSVTLNAAVANPDVQAGTAAFQYGTTTAYGHTTASQAIQAGTSAALVTSAAAGLSPATVYHYRLVATNPDGTVFGPDQMFTTAPAPPVPSVATRAAKLIGVTTATLQASVNPNGGPTTAYFQYGRNSKLGSATSTSVQVVGSGTSNVPVSANLTGLSAGKKYYYRVRATNASTGVTTTGAIKSFTTHVPLKRINATMEWAFAPSRTFASVTRLQIMGVPVGASVTVVCHGGGCPYASRSTKARAPKCKGKQCKAPRTISINLAPPFKGRHLADKTRLTIRITDRGYIGKAYVFTIGRSVNPIIGCLAPGSTTPGKGC
jgi:hypothetical protein